jgi:hypothetical protein
VHWNPVWDSGHYNTPRKWPADNIIISLSPTLDVTQVQIQLVYYNLKLFQIATDLK